MAASDKRLSVNLDQKLYDRIRLMAEAEDRPMAYIMRRELKKALQVNNGDQKKTNNPN